MASVRLAGPRLPAALTVPATTVLPFGSGSVSGMSCCPSIGSTSRPAADCTDARHCAPGDAPAVVAAGASWALDTISISAMHTFGRSVEVDRRTVRGWRETSSLQSVFRRDADGWSHGTTPRRRLRIPARVRGILRADG